jgi:DNA-binding NarL/FixJ family response regulator
MKTKSPPQSKAGTAYGVHVSPREHQALNFVLSGLPDKMIQTEMSLTLGGVRRLITSLFFRFGVCTRTQLVIKCLSPPSETTMAEPP